MLALLPIPGQPLQARYMGPCTVEKRTLITSSKLQGGVNLISCVMSIC